MPNEIREFDSLIDLLEDLDREGITGIAKRRHMENFLMRKSRLRGRPYCATFELTPLCNFDCKMCFMHLTNEQLKKEGHVLTTGKWLDIARQAVDAGVRNIDLTGGECLTHPGFKEIYLYLVNRDVQVAVLTNGQLINDEHIELFLAHRPSIVQISLYGSCSDAYVKVTGHDAFQDVLCAITKLIKAGIRIQISITPNRFMQDDAEALLDLVHSLNVDYKISNSTLTARPETGRNIEDYIVENEAYIRICQLETRHRNQLAEIHSLKHVEPYRYRLKGQEFLEGPGCSAGTANFHINWKGEMAPCIAFYSVTKSVLDNSLEDAWVWIRETMKQYKEPIECKNCAIKKGCNGCAAEKVSGILNGPVNPWLCKRQWGTLLPGVSLDDMTKCEQ